MQFLSNGAISVINGLYSMLGLALEPVTVIVVLLGFSLAWLGLIELDELDRQGRKPEIGRGR
jgi:hypothetical protein